jgi:hypothetical protein
MLRQYWPCLSTLHARRQRANTACGCRVSSGRLMSNLSICRSVWNSRIDSIVQSCFLLVSHAGIILFYVYDCCLCPCLLDTFAFVHRPCIDLICLRLGSASNDLIAPFCSMLDQQSQQPLVEWRVLDCPIMFFLLVSHAGIILLFTKYGNRVKKSLTSGAKLFRNSSNK